jgi:pSer/pThr/pTyr-binding forkhead associated (FHA) protein
MGIVPAQPGLGPRLRYTDEHGNVRDHALPPDVSRVTLGRSPEADLSVPWDSEVSRLHVSVERLGSAWTIVDDGLSRNGTYLNGDRLLGRRRLREGDRVRVGATLLTFLGDEPARSDTTRLGADLPTMRSLTETQRAVLLGLCRPYKKGTGFASPASNQQIAQEVYLSVDAVKVHLRALFAKFGVEELPQNQKRLRLVELAMKSGVINERDL